MLISQKAAESLKPGLHCDISTSINRSINIRSVNREQLKHEGKFIQYDQVGGGGGSVGGFQKFLGGSEKIVWLGGGLRKFVYFKTNK